MDDPQLLSKLGKAVGVTIPEQFSFVGDVNDTLHEEGARVDDQDGLPLLNAASIGDIEVYLPNSLLSWLFQICNLLGCTVANNSS